MLARPRVPNRAAFLLLMLALGCTPSDGNAPPSQPFDPFRLPPVDGMGPMSKPGIYYRDADGDGYVGREFVMADEDPDGSGSEWIATKTLEDCDDDPNGCGADCNPGLAGQDRCDGRDQDCDGSIDEDPDRMWYVDVDGDGYGDLRSAIASCEPIEGRIEIGGDCDDDPNACGTNCSPAVQEALLLENCADGLDNDCDGAIDADAFGCDTNRPPIPHFSIAPGAGPIDETFFFDASDTDDPEHRIGELTFSWDFDGDGVFDRTAQGDPTASWKFTAEGVHAVRLRVEDPKGAWDEFVGHVLVTARDALIVVTSTVDTIADDRAITLREAIELANATPGPNTITFAGPMTIELTSGSLPVITDADTTIAGGQGVRIRGTDAATDFCLQGNGERTTILWIEIANCPEDAIEMHGTHHWIAHVRSHDNADDGVDFSSGSMNRIGPDVVVWNNGDAGFEIEGESVTIEGSRTTSNTRGFRFLGGVPAHGSKLVRNVIANNGTGVVIAPAVDRISIWQNTIYGNGGDGVRYDPPATDATAGLLHDVRNNIFAANSGYAISTGGDFAALRSNAFSGNMGRCSGCVARPEGIGRDPGLMDPASGDFRLLLGSPCIDAGEDLGLEYEGTAPDIGAFERP